MLQASASLVWLFVGLSVLVAIMFPLGLYWAERRLGSPRSEARKVAIFAAIVVTIWMAATAVAAARGWLGFESRPPTMLLAVAVMWVLAVWIGLSRIGKRLALGLPLAALVGVHAFRLPLELLMHRAYEEGVMPVQMSFSGWNFDILTGITAIVVAGLLLAGRIPLWGVRLWNWFGIVLLLNILVIAVLSTPIPLRLFLNEPANVWITQVPFVWLPMLMVMTAVIGHIVILRRLRADSAGERATASTA